MHNNIWGWSMGWGMWILPLFFVLLFAFAIIFFLRSRDKL